MVFYGVSEAFNHALEWRRGGMVKSDACPAIRATDYKCPKYVWYVETEDTSGDEGGVDRD